MSKLKLCEFATPVVALLAATLLFGQKSQTSQRSQRPASPAATARIAREVRHELVTLPYYGVFDYLAYQVNGYNVTLLGAVRDPSLKSNAESAVKGIEGVEKIDNKIEVLPTSPADDRIRIAAYRAIYGQPPLDRYAMLELAPIHIIVKNGHITLEGVVNNESEKNLAATRAASVPGAFGPVVNHLQVENSKQG